MSGSSYILDPSLPVMNNLPVVTIANYNDGQSSSDETPTLQWIYSDADDDPQTQYHLQVGHATFAVPVIDTGVVASAASAYTTPILPRTEERTLYTWRIRAYDGSAWSGWVQASNGFYLSKGEFLISDLRAWTSPGGTEIDEGIWQNDNDPYFFWDAPEESAGVLGYSYSLDELPNEEVDTATTSYYFSDDDIGDGTHTFYVKAQRSSGIWGDPVGFEIWVDTIGPTIDDMLPGLGSVILEDQPQFEALISDAASGVDPETIEMRVNRALVDAVYNPETMTVSYVPSIPLSDGDITVSLKISDIVGNEGLPLIWSFVIDTSGPAGTILINNDDETTTTNIVTLSISAGDEVTSVTEMMLSNDGVFDTEAWEPYAALRQDWALPAVDGVHKVYAKVKDAAGNVSDVFFDDITLSIIAPDTYILSGPSGITSLQSAQFTFRGSFSGCQFSYKFDNEDWSEWSGTDSVSRSGLSEDNHYFAVRAAKDLNQDGVLQQDEVDPTPALRVWTVSFSGLLKPPAEPEKPIKHWEEE
jgi:hypothetical protein